LHDVLSVVRTEHSGRMTEERPLDLERELLESTAVAAPGAVEERVARSPDVRPHQRIFTRPRLLL
jgi:hypothetical protein